jgi:hypothetical protein
MSASQMQQLNTYLEKVNNTHSAAVEYLNYKINKYESKMEHREFLRQCSFVANLQDQIYCCSLSDADIDHRFKNCFHEKLTPAEYREAVKKFLERFSHYFDVTNGTILRIIKLMCIYHSEYDGNYTKSFDTDKVDDCFEYYLLKRICDDEVEEKCVAAHDAWTLALMHNTVYKVPSYGQTDLYHFIPKKEGGVSYADLPEWEASLPVVNVQLENGEFPNIDSLGPKDLVRIRFYSFINKKMDYIRLEKRRLAQLVDYSLLSTEEKTKDMVPVLVCYYARMVEEGLFW